jgi:cystathionine gamma-synthase
MPVMRIRTDMHLAGLSSAESVLVAAGRDRRPGSPLNMPPVLASNFVLGTDRAYARDDGTPTWEALEEIVGLLEEGESVAFASGMAGIAAVFDQLHAGSQIVLPDDCYQGVAGLADFGRQKGLWSVSRLAVDDTDGWIRAAANADLLWLESPSKPMLVVADLRAICSAPRKPSALMAVDNTFATSLNQRPLDLGADVSVQSATKFIGGHSDLLAGLVTVRRKDLLGALRKSRELHGVTPGALESFLAVRGARTMALRLERAQANAIVLAKRLSSHPGVACTRYPGLSTHPTHAIARAQLRGYGTIISFDVRGDAAAADKICSRVRLVQHATSLGAVESTIDRRATIPGQSTCRPRCLG